MKTNFLSDLSKWGILPFILFSMISFFIVLLSVFAPIVEELKHYNLSHIIYNEILSNICHQKPENSFWILGRPLGICSRCFGIYLGSTIAFVLIFIRYSKIKLFLNLTVIVILLLAIFIDKGIQFSSGWAGHNSTRFISGIMGGVGTSLFMYNLTIKIHFKRGA
jgi:uncharacterized membrane protein